MTCLNDIISGITDAVNQELSKNKDVEEYVVIRTCNRLEAYISSKNNVNMKAVLDSLVRKNVTFADREFWYILEGKACIKHLFTVICGIDSLIVGEDQIQHQTKDSFAQAQKEGHVGKVLYSLFNNAIIVGKRVRTETDLNKGAVSVGYAAIELAQEKIGDLDGKDISIIGAGDMAGVIAKNLVGKGPRTVIVSNRTFERAQELAKELGGTAINLNRLEEIVSKSDLVLVATSARHDVVTKDLVESAMKTRPEKPLLLIDVSVPTNIGKDVVEIPNVSLYTMENLDSIAAKNVAKRKDEIVSAQRIIEQEMKKIEDEEKVKVANETIRDIGILCEKVRQEQVETAKLRINSTEPEKVLDDMSKAIINMISAEVIKNLRKAAMDGDISTIEAVKTIFGLDKEC
ncbi:MAG: glutamyl-tRNA reductase [archaeon]|nr:glutamyl-tRNA reductase [archaeon]